MVSEGGDGHTETESEADVMPLTSHGTPGGWQPPEGRGGKDGFSLRVSRRGSPLPTPRPQTPGLRLARAEVSVVSSSPVCGHVSWQP